MTPIKFCDITEASNLISYLKEAQRFNNVKCFAKYMKLSSLSRMLSDEMILVNNPAKMNDMYEYKAFTQPPKWNKICFASFTTQSVESIAMWSMYAQPWTDGVMISFPVSAFKSLLQNTSYLLSADYDASSHRYKPGNLEISSDGILSFARVAYIDGTTLTCTGRNDRNVHFQNPYAVPELAGYIKDAAWDYEKEARIRIDLPDSYVTDAIYLRLPEEFLKQITITTGPRFAGSVLMSLPEKYRPLINIEASKFSEKLAWIPCDGCRQINTAESL